MLAACASAPVRLQQPLASGLRPLLGAWRCTDGASWSFSPDLGGAFVEVRYREGDYALQGQIGWNEDDERLFCEAAASDGSAESSGAGAWDGDELTFFGSLRDGASRTPFRRVFRATPAGLQVRFELQQDGEFAPAHEESCARN